MKKLPTSKLVLVTDDEAEDRQAIREILESTGYGVVAAGNCAEAIAALDRDPSIDFLVADVSLPDGDGCQLAMTLNSRKPDLRVLFVSGHVGAGICRYYGLDVQDVHFLRKPFSAKELLSRIREIMESGDPFPARIGIRSEAAS